MASLIQVCVFLIITVGWFYGLYYVFYLKKEKQKIDDSDSEQDVAEDGGQEADEGLPVNRFEARARAEDAKLEQEEMQRNRDINEYERILKNPGELTKKEVIKMEKKLEKAQ